MNRDMCVPFDVDGRETSMSNLPTVLCGVSSDSLFDANLIG